MTQGEQPWRLRDMTSVDVRSLTSQRPWLIVPVGALEGHAAHLPLGALSDLVERLADDLSSLFRIPRAPILDFGVNHASAALLHGSAGLQRKTLHRVMNELISSWEASAGIEEFLILSAHASEPHREALGTIRPLHARVQVVDLSAFDPAELVGEKSAPISRLAAETALALFIAPNLVNQNGATLPAGADAALGQRIYTLMLDRVASRCFPFPCR
jgi:creatinine amidohydrolase/Fe(II)-dependent formamide hydrolase-like protein